MTAIAKQLADIVQIAFAFLETVKEAGEQGAPSGPIYAAAMQYGMSLDTYTRIMQGLVDAGRIRLSNHVYYFVK